MEHQQQYTTNQHGILLVGPNKHTLSAITKRLVGVDNLTVIQQGDVYAMYHADNKYYSADIPVGWCLDLSQVKSHMVEGDSQWPALVFVVDSDTMSFFDEIVSCWESYDSVEIPLVVAWGLCREAHASFLSDAMEWCIEHGFELIHVDDMEQEDNQKNTTASTTTNRESGIDRLEDALQAHAWPHASMKAPGFQNTTRLLDDDDLETDPDQMLFEKILAIRQQLVSSDDSLSASKKEQLMMQFLQLVSDNDDDDSLPESDSDSK